LKPTPKITSSYAASERHNISTPTKNTLGLLEMVSEKVVFRRELSPSMKLSSRMGVTSSMTASSINLKLNSNFWRRSSQSARAMASLEVVPSFEISQTHDRKRKFFIFRIMPAEARSKPFGIQLSLAQRVHTASPCTLPAVHQNLPP